MPAHGPARPAMAPGDPRHGGDPRPTSGARHSDPRGDGDPRRPGDPRHGDPRQGDPRQGDPRQGGEGPRHRTGEQPRVRGTEGPRHRTGEQSAVRGGRPGPEPPRAAVPSPASAPPRPAGDGPRPPAPPRAEPARPPVMPASPMPPGGSTPGSPVAPGPGVPPRVEPPRPVTPARPAPPRGAPPTVAPKPAQAPGAKPPAGVQPPPARIDPAGTAATRAEPADGDPPRFALVNEQPDDTRRLRLLALAGLVLVLLVALPAFLLIRDSARDAVTGGLDSLALPAWAAVGHEDQASGSRWCIQTCQWHERTWRSSKAATETDPAYRSALTAAGWTPLTTGCPAGGAGTGDYSCWQREQYRLDLWTRNAPCGLANVAPSPGASLPSAAPSPSGDLLPVPGASASAPPPTCAGALVTAKVAARIDQHWQDR
jgi:hypothetical protein